MNRFAPLIIVISVLLAPQVMASPVNFKPIDAVQPDGSPVELFVTGDEYYRYVHDAAGYPVGQDEDGWYLYIENSDGRGLSELPVGLGDPAISGIHVVPGPPDRPAEIREIVQGHLAVKAAIRESASVGVKRLGGPFRGTINEVVIFVRFAGEAEFEDLSLTFDDMFNASDPEDSSMSRYFSEVSYGRLDVRGHLYPGSSGEAVASYQDSKPRRYFQIRSARNPDGYTNQGEGYNRLSAMLNRAIEAIKPQIPSNLDLDLDNDGLAENVVFILSGDADEWADVLWPHSSILMYENSINGARLFQYNLQFRDWLLERAVGVLAHEFFHAIGAPDLYHYSHDGIDPAGPWDLMEHTAEPPQHMMAWMKYKYGFFIDEVPVVTEPGRYTIKSLQNATDNVVRIPVPGQKFQYVALEYRVKDGVFEGGLPDSGLLAYRIDDANNGNAQGPPDEVYIFRPGGSPAVNGEVGEAAISADELPASITPESNPYLFQQNGDPIGIRIYDIEFDGDSVSFSVCPRIPDCLGIECGDDGCGGSCGDCDDGNDCTLDQCVEGRCVFQFAPPASPCGLGELCINGGVCDGSGVCVADVPAECDDGNDCTMDLCADGGKFVDLGVDRFEDVMPTDALSAGIDGDQVVAGNISIGFDFPFMGDSFGWVKVFDNGLIQLSRDGVVDEDDELVAAESALNQDIPSELRPDNFIALFWDDLECRLADKCVVAYKVLGQAPDRRLIVQYNKVRRVEHPGWLMRFQAALFESGRIELRYGTMGHEQGASATVGIEGVDGTGAVKFGFNQRVLRSGMTLAYTPDPWQCVNRPKSGNCLMDGECVEAGTVDPDNPCMECRPLVNFGGWSADDANVCSDDNLCTAVDRCVAGTCTGTEPVVCKPTSQCYTAGKCEPQTGLCPETMKEDGTLCNFDSNGCTVGDACVGGECIVGTPADCSSRDSECAVGKCTSRSSNSFRCDQDKAAKAGQLCGSGPSDCSGQDVCDASGVCQPNHFDSGIECRQAAGPCDRAEFCDGAGACPEDGFLPDGEACEGEGNECFAGQCVPYQRQAQCETAFSLRWTDEDGGQTTDGAGSLERGNFGHPHGDCMSGGVRALWFEFPTQEGYSYTIDVSSPDGADVAVSLMQDCDSDACDGFVNAFEGAGTETIALGAPGFRPSVLLGVFRMDETSPAGVLVQVAREPVVVVDDVVEGDAEDAVGQADAVGDDVVTTPSGGCSTGAGRNQTVPFGILFMMVFAAFVIARSRRMSRR